MRMILPLLLAACAPGTGTVDVTVWGEDAAVDGFSSAAFADGWSIHFDRILYTVTDPTVRDLDDEEVVDQLQGSWVVDLTSADQPVPIGTLTVPAERQWFDHATAPPSGGAVGLEVDPHLVDELAARGWSRRVQGTATRGEQTLTFDWGFDDALSYSRCNDGRDGTHGLAVPPDGSAPARITLHVDHLFWDALGTEEGSLRFDAIAAADADGDGDVTAEELAAVDVIAIGYETAGLDLPDLWSFIQYSFATSAHLNGGGLCTVRAR